MTDSAMFPRNLGLPEGPANVLQEAAIAIKEEYRNSVRWKRLRCRQIDDLGDELFRLQVGHSIQFDWTWEGSVAFRPNAGIIPDEGTNNLEAISTWMGDVVEVDETEGYLYVIVNDPQNRPQMGSFYVRPFEFLAQLNAVYNDSRFSSVQSLLPAKLHASRGNVHPFTGSASEHGLTHLKPLWQHSWCALWGPPGTGKTYTIGEQVAAFLDDHPDERILIVSTTNKATDEAALATGRALWRSGKLSAASKLLRIGKGADYDAFVKEGLEQLLEGSESHLRRQIGQLKSQWDRANTLEEKARIKAVINELRKKMQDGSLVAFLNLHFRSIVSTAFNALRLLTHDHVTDLVRHGVAPFTTVIIDEAGLISRLALAPLACLASRRVVLVGDPRQLSPISTMCRILPSNQATWLRSSGLTHLKSEGQQPSGVQMLTVQHRMHPDIRSVVSKYQYADLLKDAPAVVQRKRDMGANFDGQKRTIWYVLDEDTEDIPKIRAERGPGNRSWIRPWTKEVLKRLFADSVLAGGKGLFITPFVAQARAIRQYLAQEGMSNWQASTVHSQQGTEADYVIFDTVNAGSYGWAYDEWQRLINVGISRARELCILLASRSEMQEPYLASLQQQMAPRVFRWRGSRWFWDAVPAEEPIFNPDSPPNPTSLGAQLERRKTLRPVLSKEQQRLAKLPVDGRPRLVRGVAGSGKSVVLAYWVCSALEQDPNATLWVLYGNAALYKLLEGMIHHAWKNQCPDKPLPANQVILVHIKDLMNDLLKPYDRSMSDFKDFEYDLASEALLNLCPAESIKPRCDAIFIDEAQDFGPNTLRVVSRLARQTQPDEPSKRPVMIFYDNAQNVNHQKPPTWSELGIDIVGRSTVMEESFRSTKPITEFALNVLYRFMSPGHDPDYRELANRGLVEQTKRNGKDWWSVRFNHIDGPLPTVHKFSDLTSEAKKIGEQIVAWIEKEYVKAEDIRIICMNRDVRRALEKHVKPRLAQIGVNLEIAHKMLNKGGAFKPVARTVVAATPNSFKGWDSEIVVVAGADYFAAGKGVLAHSLYTAMTRARSLLAVYGQQNAIGDGKKIMPVLQECRDLLVEGADNDFISPLDDMNDIIERLGEEHRAWVEGIGRKRKIEQEPVTDSLGEILLEPLFHFETLQHKYICFGHKKPSLDTRNRAEDCGFRILNPGSEYE